MKKIHILHTNDLHSQFEQVSKLFSMVSTIRKSIHAAQEGLLLVDIGDHLDRARLETEGTDGWINRSILEAFMYDVITFGNNELLTFLPERIGTLYQEVPFSVVSSNVKEVISQKRPSWLDSSKVIIQQGVRIGFLGVTIPFDTYYEQMGWYLTDPIHAIKQEVLKLDGQVDLLIVLSHLGISNDQKLANEIPEIDLIIGGHTHHLLEKPEKIGKTWIAAAGLHGKHLGHVTIEWDESKNTIKQLTGVCHEVTQASRHLQMEQLLQKYGEHAEQTLASPVVHLADGLEIAWDTESPLANLLADSLQEWTGTEIALVNSGQLLAGLPDGLVTKQMIHQICPHPINPVILEIKGAELRTILEESLQLSNAHKKIRGFGFRGKILGNIAVAGLHIVYDPTKPDGQQIHAITFQHEPLMDNEVYKIGTIDMLTFGVGYSGFNSGRVLQLFMPEFLRDLLYHQLQRPSALNKCRKQRFSATSSE